MTFLLMLRSVLNIWGQPYKMCETIGFPHKIFFFQSHVLLT